MLSSDNVLYECFGKKGSEYQCAISLLPAAGEEYTMAPQFKIVLKIPQQQNYIRFLLSSTGDGHWSPDEKKVVDPWLADAIGRIIVENF